MPPGVDDAAIFIFVMGLGLAIYGFIADYMSKKREKANDAMADTISSFERIARIVNPPHTCTVLTQDPNEGMLTTSCEDCRPDGAIMKMWTFKTQEEQMNAIDECYVWIKDHYRTVHGRGVASGN